MASGHGMDGQFALEMQGLQRLKHSARQDPAGGAGEAARQFEALFIQMMVKSMRQSVPDGGLLNSQQTEFYQSLLDQQWSQTMASRGIGLAEVLVSELESRGMVPSSQHQPERAAAESETRAEALIAGIPRGAPRVLRDAIQPDIHPPSQSRQPAPGPSSPEAPVRSGGLGVDGSASRAARQFMDEIAVSPASQAPSSFMDELVAAQARPALPAEPRGQPVQTAASGSRAAFAQASGQGDMPGHVRTFLARLSAPAQAASRATGVPAELILAQAALETGWGRHEIPTRDGGNSHNLFGIKAGSHWRGETTEIATHEVYRGQRQQVRDDFRVYGSFEEAFTDYARLIGTNPRYAAVITAGNAPEAARALQRGGYATDPAYADKLIAVMRSMGALDAGALEGAPLEDTTTLASAGSIGLGRLR